LGVIVSHVKQKNFVCKKKRTEGKKLDRFFLPSHFVVQGYGHVWVLIKSRPLQEDGKSLGFAFL
jgi:hypothetical protein